MTTKHKTFEEAIAELEALTNKIQDKNISLDEALKSYETGKKLVSFCQNKLKEVEQKIQILNEDDELTEFEIEQ